MQDRKYSVQFVIIREVEVEASDDLQAEREAFQKLKPADAESALALKVFELLDPDPGALSEDLSESWKYAREHFETIDRDWVS